ncbi:MAG: hypothetical protein C5B58_07930 [Acidobacteria bacterium]|nr:MAG: hypothetical protein C5B58_07930 [Acidobacteriota bacterium]
MRTRTILAAAALLAAFVTLASATADDSLKKDKPAKEPTAAQLKIAKAIAMGHSYEKHVVDEKLFPEVKNREEFTELIAKVLANPTHHRELENDREAFFDNKSNTIVIYNPHARDKGTCFRPRAGLKYFEGLK